MSKLREVGVPPKATVQWLESIGFKSKNDRGMINVLKQIDFASSGGVPTGRWKQYRGADHKGVLGEALRVGYADLFETYPDAESRSSQDLEHFFSTRSTAGKQVISKTASTFQSLVGLAEFTSSAKVDEDPGHLDGRDKRKMRTARKRRSGEGEFAPNVHIDIQIHISPETTSDQIDEIFAAMAKHFGGSVG
jgi:hypothetical protein